MRPFSLRDFDFRQQIEDADGPPQYDAAGLWILISSLLLDPPPCGIHNA
ncbi:hypothetical protein EKH55_2089 [Sinorhizobium alkalisoli]|nr:hypothetical protein EKH55_2089 [Sinorhizobium alkalisoli]